MKTKFRVCCQVTSLSFLIVGILCCANKVAFQSEALSSLSIPPGNNNIPPLYCSTGHQGQNQNYYPSGCLLNPGLPGNAIGFEMNNLISPQGGPGKHLILSSDDPVNGSRADVILYIEFSTYVAPDTVVINATTNVGTVVPLLNNCNISTYTQADPTNGTVRPYSDTILQFNVVLPTSTVQLDFDFTGALTPTYLGVWNLNDFSISLNNPDTNPFSGSAQQQFRVQPAPLSKYNDNADPLVQEPACPNT